MPQQSRRIGATSRRGGRRLAAALLAAGTLVGGAGAAVGPVQLITRGIPSSDTGNGYDHAVSADGRYVVFLSDVGNVVPGQVDRGGTSDVFLHDRETGVTTLVSRSAASPLTTANESSGQPVISADGAFVAFSSTATDLVAGLVVPDPCCGNVFLYERASGQVTLVSRVPGSPVTAGLGGSFGPVISGDGAYVAFVSTAPDLVAGQLDDNDDSDVFLYDRVAGTTALVSRTPDLPPTAGNDRSFSAVISETGAFVAFVSRATNLISVQQDADETDDVFLYDRALGTVTLVSRTAAASGTTGDGPSTDPAISADGAFVAFVSEASNLSPAQTEPFPGSTDVFLYNRGAQTTTLVSHSRLSTIAAAGLQSRGPRISADGRFVVYDSLGQSLALGTHGDDGPNVFLYDRTDDSNTLLSATPTARGFSDRPAISADGQFVAFRSTTPDLVPGQVDSAGPTLDLFVYSRPAATTTLVSHTAASPLTAGNGPSVRGLLSADGRFVVFESFASDLVAALVDLNGSPDVFVFDRLGGTTVASRRDPAAPGDSAAAWSALSRQSLSADGRFVAFISRAANLVAGQADDNQLPDVFLHDRGTGSTSLVSRTPAGTAGNGAAADNDYVLSADGRFVAFVSTATDLVAGQVDLNGAADVFLFDRLTGATTLVSATAASPLAAGNGRSARPGLSADGRFVAFQSEATNLVAGQSDGNGDTDVFLYDRELGITTLASRTHLSALTTGNSRSETPVISADGRVVAFVSEATDLMAGLVDTLNSSDVFVYERETGAMALASRIPTSALTAGLGDSDLKGLSADGRFVLFQSYAPDLVLGNDTNLTFDVFVHDRLVEVTTLVSRTPSGPGAAANGTSFDPVMSGDGRFVAFVSEATDLVADHPANNGARGVFLHDRTTGTTTLVSRSLTSAPFNAPVSSHEPAISADGRLVAFESVVVDLAPGQQDANDTVDVFLHDRDSGTTLLASRALRTRADASAAVTGDAGSRTAVLSADGRVLVFLSTASNLTGDADLNGQDDVFVLARACPGGLGRGPALPCPGAAGRPGP